MSNNKLIGSLGGIVPQFVFGILGISYIWDLIFLPENKILQHALLISYLKDVHNIWKHLQKNEKKVGVLHIPVTQLHAGQRQEDLLLPKSLAEKAWVPGSRTDFASKE